MNIHIKADRANVFKIVTLDQMIGIQEGNLRDIAEAMSNFVLDENGNYMDKVEARKLLGKLTIEELQDASTDFQTKLKDTAVPPTNGDGSASPSKPEVR